MRAKVLCLDDRTEKAYIRAMNGMNVHVTKHRRLPDSTISDPFYRGFAAAYNNTHKRGIGLGILEINASDKQKYWDGYTIGEIQRGVDCIR
ncbi:hypothetical protein HYX04_04250 [Candidatus Woesearchaeota archaeon]|nr:hypothetical protein [Candidatus Woesearchaeota archaeon]